MSIKLLFFPLTLVILVWSVIGITKPAWDEYKIQKSEVIKISQEKEKLEIGIVNMKKCLVEYQGLDENTKAYVNNAIPANSDDDNLIAELNKNISQSGVLVMRISTNKKMAKINPQCRQQGIEHSELNCAIGAATTNIVVSATGVYSMIKNFLDKLDVQNRIVLPRSINLAATNSNREEESTVELITAKVNFDVFQKKPVKIKSFSSIMASDNVLKSLFQGKLNTNGLTVLNEFVTSEVFVPVQVEGVGKSDLFKKGDESNGQKDLVIDNSATI
jgi:hypothetical protein